MLIKIIRPRIDNQAKQISSVKIYAQHGDVTTASQCDVRMLLMPVSSLCDCLFNVCFKYYFDGMFE